MNLFSKKSTSESFAILDIHSVSVAGAISHTNGAGQSSIVYTTRHDINRREHENTDDAMLRTLEEVAARLLSQGGPALRKETGSGHISKILVSIGSPWQKTSVRTEHINPPKPFIFTRAIVTETIQKSTIVPEGYVKSGESLIASILNGYEIAKPYGKHVARADLVILSSFLEKKVSEQVEKTLRKTYHTHALRITGFAPVAYSVFQEIYPHEKDFLVVHVGSESTEIAVIKRSLLMSVSSVDYGTNALIRSVNTASKNIQHAASWVPTDITDSVQNEHYQEQVEKAKTEWIDTLRTTLQELSAQNALPRTLFLLAEESSREYLRNTLDSKTLRSLWLTEEPLRIIPVAPSQFNPLMPSRTQAEGDVFLALLALYVQKDRSL